MHLCELTPVVWPLGGGYQFHCARHPYILICPGKLCIFHPDKILKAPSLTLRGHPPCNFLFTHFFTTYGDHLQLIAFCVFTDVHTSLQCGVGLSSAGFLECLSQSITSQVGYIVFFFCLPTIPCASPYSPCASAPWQVSFIQLVFMEAPSSMFWRKHIYESLFVE